MEPGEKVAAPLSFIALLAAAVSAGAMLVPTLGMLLNRHVPCGVEDPCALIEMSGRSHWAGIPIGVWGVAGLALTLVLTLSDRTRPWAKALGFFGAALAGILQIRVLGAFPGGCPWCQAATLAWAVFAVALLPLRRWKGDIFLIVPSVLGLAAPFLIAGRWEQVPAEPIAMRAQLGLLKRAALVPEAPRDHLTRAIFVSPACPTCRKELPGYLWGDRADAGNRLRAIPLGRSRLEQRAVIYLQLAFDRGDAAVLRALITEAPLDQRVAEAKRLRTPTPQEWSDARDRVMLNQQLAREAKIRSLPTIYRCPPAEDCVPEL